MTNGLNLVQWVDNLSSVHTRTKEWVSDENLAMLKADGFETLRIPMSPVLLTFGSFTEWDKELIAMFEERVGRMLEMGFSVILNAWKYGSGTKVMSDVVLNNSKNGAGDLPPNYNCLLYTSRCV